MRKLTASGLTVAWALLLLPSFLQAETASKVDLAKSLAPFMGTWSGDVTPNGGPAGEMTVIVEQGGMGSFVSISTRYKIGGKGKAILLTHGIVRVEEPTNRLHSWFHGIEGRMDGPTEISENTCETLATGVTNRGQAMTLRLQMELDDDKLILSQSDGLANETPIPDERVILDRVPSVAEESEAAKSDPELLAELQGVWRLERGNGGWVIKQIDGNHETLTRYNAEGAVDESHRATISVQKAGDDKRFSIATMEFTAGPRKGIQVPQGLLQNLGYVYRVDSSAFTEIHSRPDGTTQTHRWRRVGQ
ncbi:hypothetical protein [Crateriforma conspicua]|uniref:DUF306 domain-containing protein n=1 Tax=Crateriforma conspicua TaxID=2527996 RepID=A0A5C6FTF8_9PLAN|nr:hypothetical protein [Crateriforma conspicua]TWU65651.1 hypothetical protein V7x_11990 [Crateriforma conspicua]